MQCGVLKWALGAVACILLIASGCTAPDRYREIAPGMTSEEVLAILGDPDSRRRGQKQAPTGPYFGPKPSDTYLELPEGTLVELWTYNYFREVWTYIFTVEEQMLTVVDTVYYHPDIVY